ncbi:MAG: polysulfide reductase NrfD [Bacteroidales bacterium]|jgi:protein NrfD|nr:polysulfide reductase NrfD [Bacteroidales bacterium]
MKEVLFASGRNIPNVDPQLHAWHWPIPVYLFLGGLAAGLLFFASYYTIMGKEKEMPAATKWAPFFVPITLVVGLGALFYDLTNKLFFWRLYTTIRIESPMSWGAWALMIITPLSFLWIASYLKEIFPNWSWKYDFLEKIMDWVTKNRKVMAWILLPMSIILGIYTGILLSAFNARPLWNNSILGPLFLVSGLSTAAALIVWLSKDAHEKHLFTKIDLVLIATELFILTHMFMGFQAGTSVQQEAAFLLNGGEFTVVFWVFVVILGLVFPAILEISELIGYKVPVAVPAMLVIIGGLVFRFVMVEAGQITRYLY